ncbi:MAG TPA: ATP-dependent RNA helicase RhlE, partial [Opitutae bacterium]|nr:ATP-dependent RNA helicase RhlE [Opitutae bacterium]
RRREANLSAIEILVLDEADRMLDMGFIHDIKKILKLLPRKRQNLLFSATYSREVKKLADTILSEPVEVEVAPRNATADRVDQEAFEVRQKSKRSTLSSMISKGKWSQVLVFTRTKHGANRLTTQLNKDGVTALAIHGNKSQSAREKALASFKAHKVRVLVATDIAARGLDIVSLPYVVNFELPNIPEDYVHRIGRTGRAGLSGKAISLVSETESEYLIAIEKLLKKRIPLFQYREDDDNLEIERLSSSPPLHSRSNNRSHPNQSTNSRPPSRKRRSQRNKTGRKGNAKSDTNQKSRSPTKLQDKTPKPRHWKPRKIRPASMK